MPITNTQLVALGVNKIDRSNIRDLLADHLRSDIFSNYNPDGVFYEDERANRVATGLPALLAYIDANPNQKVFLGHPARHFDLALEGGSAFGFAHLGTLHAMALRGIWFDRVSGTSAGSIAAALIAAGYMVDLNYKTITDKPTTSPLKPDGFNSLNQILFDDKFADFTDFEQTISGVKSIITNDNSFVYKLVAHLVRSIFHDVFSKVSNFGDDLELNLQTVHDAYLNIESRLIDMLLGFRIVIPNLVNIKIEDIGVPATAITVGSSVRNAAAFADSLSDLLNNSAQKLIDDLTSNTGPVHDAIQTVLTALLHEVRDSIVEPLIEGLIVRDGNLDHFWYGLFRLFEFGGFWEGNTLRKWMELHLQAIGVGTGELLDGTGGKPEIRFQGQIVRAVLFRDLPMDLCIVAADMGPVAKDDSDQWDPQPVYFSKRTTPDYPVAEAVRRSVSLPLGFIPRKINDGYGNNPPNVLLPDKKNQIRSTKRSLVPGFSSQDLHLYENTRHHNHVLLDGGLFINVPVAVFRDPSSFVFDEKTDTKPLVISNINQTIDSSTRPHDVPRPRLPEPIKSITTPVSGGNGLDLSALGMGYHKILRSLEFLGGFAYSEHSETEINSLLQLVPNSFFVDIPLRDPSQRDRRMDGTEFNMSKTTKKWLVQNGFEAAKAALAQYENEFPAFRNKLALPASLNPYSHILEITNATASGVRLPNPVSRCKQGDNPYTNGKLVVVQNAGTLTVGNQNSRGYVGMGGTWIKMANNQAHRSSASNQFLSFETNLRTRVFLALDGAPAFATAGNGWEAVTPRLAISNGQNPLPTLLNVFSKIFEKGAITIPGPRFGGSISNQFAYAVLVCPI